MGGKYPNKRWCNGILDIGDATELPDVRAASGSARACTGFIKEAGTTRKLVDTVQTADGKVADTAAVLSVAIVSTLRGADGRPRYRRP